MTLHRLVKALGGDLYAGGFRANIPAPGHSPHDRSVSLLLTQGRVVIHGFGGADWRRARDWLQTQGFIDTEGRLTGVGHSGPCTPRPDARQRHAAAARLWDEGHEIGRATVSRRYLALRAISEGMTAPNLRHHPHAPTSVYQPGRYNRPAFMSRISDDMDRLTAVELTYLDPNGARASGLRLSRKTVGHVPRGAAVRLAPSAPEMLVGEGVISTLAAMQRFDLPGWALRSANNLAAWTPPEGVHDVLIAADNGRVGLEVANRLKARLMQAGLIAGVHGPDPRFVDWGEAAVAAGGYGRREEGR